MKIFITILFISSISYSQNYLNTKNNIFLKGYDLVEYFESQKAVKGKKEFSYTLNKVNYYFSSKENLKRFINKPKNYMPEYGGWCAYGLAGTVDTHGFKADTFRVDPKTFTFINDKLYFFYNDGKYNALEKWKNHKEKPQLNTANKNWKEITRQNKAGKH